jgi:hypothetical protein
MFQAALREVEEAAKTVPKKKPTASKSPSSFPVSHLCSPPAPERPWYGVVT